MFCHVAGLGGRMNQMKCFVRLVAVLKVKSTFYNAIIYPKLQYREIICVCL
jgi:hypothetical protein